MKFGVGVIGATGYIGAPYRAEIRESPEDARIVALCARRQELLGAAGAEDRAELTTNDWRQVVDHPHVNLVIVATPDALHGEAVLACAQRGKPVVCEKPVGRNVVEALEMWTAFKSAGLASFVPFWTRYVPAFIAAREIVESGELGQIRSLVYRWHNPRPPQTPFTWRDNAELSSSGSIGDVGSHAYDTMRWMTALEGKRVLAHADIISPEKPDRGEINLQEALDSDDSPQALLKTRRATAVDYATIAFEMENGAVGTLILSHAPAIRKGLSPELELHGQQASMAVDRISGRLTIVRGPDQVRVQETVPYAGFGNRFAKHVFPAIRAQLAGQPNSHPTLQDGWLVQRFTDAAARSAREGRWVDV